MKNLAVSLLSAVALSAQPLATELWLRGYSVIPTPQKVELAAADVRFEGDWRLDSGGLGQTHIAVRTLVQDLREFHGIELKLASSRVLRLAIRPGSVAPAADPPIAQQAYRLKIAPSLIEITANGGAGLFYGVQTLVQLFKRAPDGTLLLPEAAIEDWPRLEMRFLHWDTKHHQDRIPTLKRYLDWAARFKINRIGFELEDKFAYPSNPIIGAPGAFTAAQLQEIVDYGLERFIQVTPVIQAPAHMGYVLKHRQFAHLRADGNNYQACLCDEESYKLIFRMYDDVIAATKGVDYFFVSTDEVYYAGICAKCTEPYNEGNRSLKWAGFAQRARDHLAQHGRRMLAWIEYPLLPEHIKLLPSDIIDGVMGDPKYAETEKQKGMRQLIYVSMQGGEYLFPDYFRDFAEGPQGEFERGQASGRLQGAFDSITSSRVWQVNPIGVFGAAWDDSGLHNETFWLGWSAVAQYGWTPGTPSPEQHAAEFMRLYYGPRATGMAGLYRTMQLQARAWQRTWDRVVSRVRGPGYGNSYGKGIGTTRYDLTLSPPPLPAPPDLRFEEAVAGKYARFLEEAKARYQENDRLLYSLAGQMHLSDRNQYNLEVLSALARFTGHHWRLLLGLAGAEKSLQRASESARNKKPAEAVGHLVAAHNRVRALERDGAEVFRRLTETYEKSRFPKGQSAGGSRFVHVLDDTKDHWADRTPDLGFMMAPEAGIGLPRWLKDLNQVIQPYAKSHNVPVAGLREARLEE
ncbi:MAG: beta-N-acetylhexosaminidase [Acidobacteria bacterium]|nr:beta-N-acetylhexosaminidase [Acidobacteriota bacterium]